jgi:hypothetical protein
MSVYGNRRSKHTMMEWLKYTREKECVRENKKEKKKKSEELEERARHSSTERNKSKQQHIHTYTFRLKFRPINSDHV